MASRRIICVSELEYNYGANWRLVVTSSRVPPGRATLLGGARAGPPEDSGGIHGYRMIGAAADPTHPDHRQALADVTELVGDEVAQQDVGLVVLNPASRQI